MSDLSVWREIHPKLGISMMDHLFNRFDGMYPNRWRSSFPNEHAIENWASSWAEAFQEDGITPALIADGLKACRKLYDWPPSVTEFIKACIPEINAEVGLYEAIAQIRARQQAKDEWTHPAIFWAATKVGQYDMLSQAYAVLLPRFKRALDDVLKTEVKPVPPSVPALAYDVGTISTKEKADEQLRKLGAMNVVNNKKSGIEWAHKMLARVKNGEHIPGNGPEIARRVIAERTGA